MQRPLLSSILLLALTTSPAQSTPLSQKDLDFLTLYNQTSPAKGTRTHPPDARITTAPFRASPLFMPRGECNANPCGWNSWLCCGPYATCYTDAATQAQCASIGVVAASQPAAGGTWSYYTTTYCVTEEVYTTAVWSTYIPPAVITTTEECGCEETITPTPSTSITYIPPPPASTETAVPLQCDTNSGECACGNICCPSGQQCIVDGQCGILTTTTASGTYSAPLRATTSTLFTVTVSPTTTVGFEPAIATGSNATLVPTTANSTALSGGAIAGIVIGVIIGIILLTLLCLFFCLRGVWNAGMGLLGLGGDKRSSRRRRTTTEEYRRHDSRADGRRQYDRYTDRPGRTDMVQTREKEKGGGMSWAGPAAALGGLAVLLGLSNNNKSKDQRRRRDREKSEYSGSSYYESEEYSEESSDRRTADTRRSRR